jgi:hypothetical protein
MVLFKFNQLILLLTLQLSFSCLTKKGRLFMEDEVKDLINIDIDLLKDINNIEKEQNL